jgi:glyoxylase-like metal-dependent hydrolase (beta-lactamase superfamily II)
VSEIAPGIRSIAYRKGGRVHCFLLESADGLTLIDTGYDSDARPILDELAAIQKQPKDIKRILLTHGHKSHVGGLAMIAELSEAPVYSSEDEAPIVEGLQKAEPVGFDLPKPWNLEVYILQLALNAGIGKHTPRKVDVRLQDGAMYGPVQALRLPGHTKGSFGFWWPEKRALFAGDSLATWPALAPGWESFNLDDAAQAKSVGKLADLSAEILAVGHGEPISHGAWASIKSLVK